MSPERHIGPTRPGKYDGTFAEFVAVPEQNVLDKPQRLSFAEAACLPTAYLTAYRALFSQAGLKKGDAVLIQGAGGAGSRPPP
nr:medium chain dehydrogenase/reductase family protein [Streptomyces blattellae]